MRAVKTLVILCLFAFAVTAVAGDSARSWPKHKGQWFDIKYPPGFKVTPRDVDAYGHHDGASFVSLDGQVEFYVYSPRFQGDSWWMKRRSGETLGGLSTEQSAKFTVRYGTFRGPRGKYSRSYADVTNKTDGSRHVFGIRYNSQTAYQKYRPRYLVFKGSLVQYAD